MRELALSRRFYPVVALDIGEGNYKGSGKSYGKGRKNNGGRSKGKKEEERAKGKVVMAYPLPGAK